VLFGYRQASLFIFLTHEIPRGKDTEARDVLANRSAINLLLAYAIALKHHLREERGTYYDDLYPLVKHLPRHFSHFTSDGRPPSRPTPPPRSFSSFSIRSSSSSAASSGHSTPIGSMGFQSRLFYPDPKDLACQGTLSQGNLPLEIANYLSNYAELVQADGRLSIALWNALQSGTCQLVEVLTNCERILRTPIPLAYNIAISQTGNSFFKLQMC
jgi:ion channel-forming bestrophin family protein